MMLATLPVLKQLPIDDDSKERLLRLRTDMFFDTVNDMAEQLYTGEITIGQWQEQMKAEIRQLHTSTGAIGKGGWEEMTSQDWGRLGPRLKAEYKWLARFADYVSENRDTVSLQYIQNRARLYGHGAAHSAVVIETPLYIADLLPWLPKDGTTKCFFWPDKVKVLTRERGYVRLGGVKKGDHVLTHEGHFKRVLNLTKRVESDVDAVELLVQVGKKEVKVCVTADHMFMGEEGWIRADVVQEGHKLARIAKKCVRDGCDNFVMPTKDGCCSRSCATKHHKKWEKANERVRELVVEGNSSLQKWHESLSETEREAEAERMRRLQADVAASRVGRTYEELYGEEHAAEIKQAIADNHFATGKTWEELYGEERAQELKQQQHVRLLGNQYGAGTPGPDWTEYMSEEDQERMRRILSEAAKRQWEENYESQRQAIIDGIIAADRSSTTKPELAMKELLQDEGITYKEQQWLFGKYRVDFYLPAYKTVVEVDGEYWHNYPYGTEADKAREAELEEHGYTVLRYWANDVLHNSEEVCTLLRTALDNHDGKYHNVTDCVVLSAKRVQMSGTVRCLVVEDDASFVITNGLVSHNCLNKCKCHWKLDVVSTEGLWQIVEAVWTLSPAEHCDTCIGRSGHTEVLRIPPDVTVPSTLGGY